ncbi:MAG TPA: hypothetical protein VGL44_03785, partial [Gaiellales bacterium]
GPIGEATQEGAGAVRVDDLAAAVHARDHRVFAGRLDRSRLGPVQRTIARMVRSSRCVAVRLQDNRPNRLTITRETRARRSVRPRMCLGTPAPITEVEAPTARCSRTTPA